MAGTGVLCYPDQAKVLAGDAGKLAVKNARIAYHFIVGGIKNIFFFLIIIFII
jgi:hypothetical protein